jgi:uncharacterized protein YacL
VLTASEKRFIQSWEEQRKGGKVKYYLLYIIAGTFVGTLISSFLSAVLALGFPDNLVWIVVVSFLIVTVATIVSWGRNEKKFRSIIQREIKQGMEKDEQVSGQ